MFQAKRKREWLGRNVLGLGLWSLFLVCTFLILKSSRDPLPSPLRGTVVESVLSEFRIGNQIIFNVAVGIVVSLILYVLVVKMPEYDKRRRLRRSLKLQYESFKGECIKAFVEALGQGYDPTLIDRLKDRNEFRHFFKESFSPDQSRWDAVANRLDECKIKGLIVECEILMAEVHFTLTAVDVENSEAFAFLKSLAQVLYRSRNWSPGYDEVKHLLTFMWSVHTGWDFIGGYIEKDVVAEMIAAI